MLALHEVMRLAERRWTALVRARARRLLRALPRPERNAARFLPVLLHCSFRAPGLADLAPGVAGLSPGRRWGELARACGLPSPHGAQHGRRLVEAVWLVPGSPAELVVVPVGNLVPAEQRLLDTRVASAARLLGDRVRVSLRERVDGAAVLYGGLLAGSAHGADAAALAPADWAHRAPAPLAALLSALVPWADSPQAFLGWTAELPVWWLADAELFAALWARWRDGIGALPLETVAAAGTHPLARRAAAHLAGDARGVREIGRALCLAIFRGRRTLPAPLVQELREEMLAIGMPAALLPALRLEVQERGEEALGRRPIGGRAMLRHLVLRARLGMLPEHDPFWRQVAIRLQRAGSDAAIAEIDFVPGAEPPFDPLNRGPMARLCLAPGQLLRTRRGKVHAPRLLEGSTLLHELLRSAASGVPCDLVGGERAAPLIGRLDRLLRRTAEVAAAGGRLAVEAGGLCISVERGRLRRFPRERFLARPRHGEVDPEAPLLGATTASVRRAIECTVAAAGSDDRVWLLYGGEGLRFGETVPLGRLAAHLRETRALLDGEAALLVRHTGATVQLPPAEPDGAAVQISVGGDLLRGIWIEVLGERFGAGEHWGWEAAASAIAAAWPVETTAPLAFPQVHIRVAGRRATPVERLYARSVARRRLWIHIRRLLGT